MKETIVPNTIVNEMILSPEATGYIDITLTMDFGERSFSKHLRIPHGFSIGQTLEYLYEVKRGPICTDRNGILAINEYGTALPYKYWTMTVNGNFINVNSHTILNQGDQLELEYHVS